MTLRFLLEKEFRLLRRNRFLKQLIVAYPLMIMLVFPWAVNMEIKNMNLIIVDHKESPYSKRLSQKAFASGYFNEVGVVSDYEEAIHRINQNKADVLIEFPYDFEKKLIKEGTSPVLVAANSVNGVKGGLASTYITSIVNSFNRDLLEEEGYDKANEALVISVLSRFNPLLDYKLFMIPALMVVIITLICGFLPALNIVSEKETGTIEQMNVSPVSKVSFVLSKLLPYWILGFILLTICGILADLIYGMYPKGGILNLYFFTLLFVLVISGLGIIISNNSRTLQQAMFIMFFFLIVFILMSGLFTPINSMPRWAQVITYFNPLRYYIEIMRSIYLKGTHFTELSSQGGMLVIFAIVFYCWAIITYRKSS